MNKEQLSSMRKQCDTAETNVQNLNAKVAKLISELDTCSSECTQLNQKKDILQKNLDIVKQEKKESDKNIVELNNRVGILIINISYTLLWI